MTEKTQPTDAEILDAADDFRSQYKHGGTTFDEFDEIGFARAILAKWGALVPTNDLLGLPNFRPGQEPAPPVQEAQLNPDMPTQELRLHLGELTTDEVLVARAAIRWANSQQEARVPLSSKECRDMLEEVDPYNFAIDLIRAVEKHHGITAAQKEATCAPTPSP